jgi:hypothetical protein
MSNINMSVDTVNIALFFIGIIVGLSLCVARNVCSTHLLKITTSNFTKVENAVQVIEISSTYKVPFAITKPFVLCGKQFRESIMYLRKETRLLGEAL